jgi:4-hydroxy-L-threonine phosphate dehydrogenase PdxA
MLIGNPEGIGAEIANIKKAAKESDAGLVICSHGEMK